MALASGFVRLDGLKFCDSHFHQPFRRQYGFIAVNSGRKGSGLACKDGAGVARRLRLERLKFCLQRADARLQRAAVRVASGAPQDQALEFRRQVGDGVHVAQRQIAAQLCKIARDVRVERGLIVDAGNSAPCVLKLLDLAGQFIDARLAGLCILGAVAGGDGVVRGHMGALGAVQNRCAVLRIQKFLLTHDKAGGVIARPGFVWCDGGRHEWCIEAAYHVIAEIRGDRGKQDPEDNGKIGFALLHSAPSGNPAGAERSSTLRQVNGERRGVRVDTACL